MFLRNKHNGEMIKVLTLDDLFCLSHPQISGRYQWGEEEQEPENFNKVDLMFLSGEGLPSCWTDPHYRDDELKR